MHPIAFNFRDAVKLAPDRGTLARVRCEVWVWSESNDPFTVLEELEDPRHEITALFTVEDAVKWAREGVEP